MVIGMYLWLIATGVVVSWSLFRLATGDIPPLRNGYYGGDPDQYRYRATSPVGAWLFGCIGLGVCGYLTLTASNELREFRNDPVCAAGFSGKTAAAALCRVVPATIRGHEFRRGKNNGGHYLYLNTGDGSTREVGLAQFPDAFWSDIQSGDTFAAVKFYRGKIVAVQTNAGTASTESDPAIRASDFELDGIVFGVLGIVMSLALTFCLSPNNAPSGAGPPTSYPPGPLP